MLFSKLSVPKKYFFILFFVCFCLLASCSPQDPEEQAIIDTVERFFSALATRNANLAKEVLFHEGVSFSVRKEEGAFQIRTMPHLQMIDSLSSPGQQMLERMWKPKVLLHDRIAILWTKYDFHLEGKFSHCGVDAFNLIKTSQGWKISGIIYSVEKEGCEDSPLGPPGDSRR